MRVIIAGSRYHANKYLNLDAVVAASRFVISEVVIGGGHGIDAYASQWARKYNLPVTLFEPEWETHGLAAGQIRNREMVKYAQALIMIGEWLNLNQDTRDLLR